MATEMFRDVVNPSVVIGGAQRYTVPCSIAAHVAVACAAVIVPLMATDSMPPPSSAVAAFVTPAAPPPAPPPPAPRTARVAEQPRADTPPLAAPEGVRPEPPRDSGDEGTRDNTEPGRGIIEGPGPAIAAAPEAPAAPPPPAEPVRVGGSITPPVKVTDVKPVYPAIAMAARVQGVVIIEATIGSDGHVIGTRILRSIPLLDQAAVEAVSQWIFTPTTLNGVPVPVVMTVTVQFALR